MKTANMTLDKPYSDIFEWLYRAVYERGTDHIDIPSQGKVPADCGVETVKSLRACADYLVQWGRECWGCLPPISIDDIKGGFRITLTTEFISIYNGYPR